MISWIQKYFQKHFRTVFAIMLALMIISLIYYNASGGLGRGGTGRERGSAPFLGLDLANQEDVRRLLDDTGLSMTLRNGFSVPTDSRLQLEAYGRHAALWLADQMHLPEANKAAVDSYLKNLPLFFDPTTSRFDAARFNQVLDRLETDPAAKAQFARVLADDVRVSEVQQLLLGPGFLLPAEGRAVLEQEEAIRSIAVATVDYASFAPPITVPADAELEKYFNNNAPRFTIPAQVRVDAIDFSAESFLSKVTVTDKELREFYDLNKDRYTKPEPKPDAAVPTLLAKPADKPEDAKIKADADFAAAKSKVEEDMKLDRARRLAARAAADFSVELDQKKIRPDTLTAFLAARSLTARPVAPFANRPVAPYTDLSIPTDLGAELGNVAAAFRLTAAQPFSDAIVTAKGAAILVLRDTIAAKKPIFTEVRARVVSEWQADEKRRLFAELGRTLHTKLAAALQAGTKFEEAVTAAAASASSAKLEAKTYGDFTLTQKREAGSFDAVSPALSQLETLPKGQLGEMITVPAADGLTPEKGLFVQALEIKLPDLTAEKAKGRLAMMGLSAARYSVGTALNEILQRELPKAVIGEQP